MGVKIYNKLLKFTKILSKISVLDKIYDIMYAIAMCSAAKKIRGFRVCTAD